MRAAEVPSAGSRIPHPASRIPHPASRIPHPASRIPHPASRIPHLASWIPRVIMRGSRRAHMDFSGVESKRVEEVSPIDVAGWLRGGAVAIVPTETVYGLAVAPGNASALRRVFDLKG